MAQYMLNDTKLKLNCGQNPRTVHKSIFLFAENTTPLKMTSLENALLTMIQKIQGSHIVLTWTQRHSISFYSIVFVV